ncbi:MAG TPA: 30S ribosomal protein S18 [Candidatus Acidoferrales bacterium]|nr:30S ribosomal protein S18 [Candidatus Acidoferrales bacterium]
MMEQRDNPGADRGGDAPRERGPGRGPREGGRRPSGGRRPGGPGGGGRRFFRRRKVCRFCKENMDHIDYKDVKLIGQFIGDRGKVLPRRATGVCASHQRQLKVALKRARNIALLPFAVVL